MYQQSVTEQQFRRHVAKVRGQFVDLFARDPEQALVDLLEELSDLIGDAARLDATFGFGVIDQPITTSRVRESVPARPKQGPVTSQGFSHF